MSLLIYLEEPKGQVLICRGGMSEFLALTEKAGIKEIDFIVLVGWHGKPILITDPIRRISHVIEQDDEETKKQIERTAAEQEGRRVEPVKIIPSRRGN